MNLPISTNVPQTSASNAAAAAQTSDDQTTKATDAFGSVLARQLAEKTAVSTANSSSTSNEDILAAISKDDKAKQQASTTDGTNTPPTDMLAALLAAPVALAASKPAVSQTAAPQTAAPQTIVTTATDSKLTQLANGKETIKLQPEQANSAPSTNVNSSSQNFAVALHTLTTSKSNSIELTQNPSMPAKADAPQPSTVTPPQILGANQMVGITNIPSQLSVDTPVNSKSWGDNFSQKITWLATQHDQSAELHLNPPDLGPLHVVLKVSGDQATAMFTSPHAAVRDAVEQAMPKLREMMADNGIMLGNATVSDQGQRDSQTSQSQGQQQAQSSAPASISGISSLSQGTRTLPVSQHNGLVDTFA